MSEEEKTTPGLDSYKAFVEKHWSGNPTELQYVITSHLFAESIIDEKLLKLFPHDSNIIKLGFANKLILLRSAGYGQRSLELLTDLNKLRNKFAHNLDYEVKWSDIEKLGNKERYSKKDWEEKRLVVLRRMLSYAMGYTNGSINSFTLKHLVD